MITGGAGFIGYHLEPPAGEGGAAVTLVDSLIPEYGGNLANIRDFEQDVRLNVTDVRDRHSMDYLIKGEDFLFNLAGQTSHVDSMRDPFPDLEINARAQLSILEACRRQNDRIRVVFRVRDRCTEGELYLPVDEQHPVVPVNMNGVNKVAGEHYHLVYHTAHRLRTSVLRLTNTSAGDAREGCEKTFLGIWIKNVLTGAPIKVYGTGAQVRDLAYVDDVVDAVLLSALTDEAIGTALNIGGSGGSRYGSSQTCSSAATNRARSRPCRSRRAQDNQRGRLLLGRFCGARAARLGTGADHVEVDRGVEPPPDLLEDLDEVARHLRGCRHPRGQRRVQVVVGADQPRVAAGRGCREPVARARGRRIGRVVRHPPSTSWSAAATAPAVGTRPISPTPLIP